MIRSEIGFKEQSQTYELIIILAKQSPDLLIHDPHLVNESGSDVLFEDRDPVELVLSGVCGNDPATLGRVHPHRIGYIYSQQTLVTQVTLMNEKLALVICPFLLTKTKYSQNTPFHLSNYLVSCLSCASQRIRDSVQVCLRA